MLLLLLLLHSVARGSHGAWQKFERGELSLFPFYAEFGRELSDVRNGNLWYADYCRKKGIGMLFDAGIHLG